MSLTLQIPFVLNMLFQKKFFTSESQSVKGSQTSADKDSEIEFYPLNTLYTKEQSCVK